MPEKFLIKQGEDNLGGSVICFVGVNTSLANKQRIKEFAEKCPFPTKIGITSEGIAVICGAHNARSLWMETGEEFNGEIDGHIKRVDSIFVCQPMATAS